MADVLLPGLRTQRLLRGDPAYFLDWTLRGMLLEGHQIAPPALARCREAFGRESVRHAMMADYRAGATLDLAHDREDRVVGRRLACPVQVLWSQGAPDPRPVWQDWAADVEGAPVRAGHLLAAPPAPCSPPPARASSPGRISCSTAALTRGPSDTMTTYVIFDVDIHDMGRYQAFMAGVKPALEAAGGRYLARGGGHEVWEGDWEPRRIVILEFQSREHWLSFYQGPVYTELKAVRDACSSARLVSVEGL
jgi:uncharacterized protein (DUF1330 family)